MSPALGRAAAVLTAVAFLAAACGGNTAPRAQPSTGTTATSPGSPGQPGVSPGPTVTATPRNTPPATTGPPTSPTATPTQEVEVVVTLDRACVRRGVASDVQGITVRTNPGYPAGYVTEYSDGSTIINHPEYSSGGQGSGFADDSGVWRDTWVVPKAAPVGKAIVHVNAGTVDPPRIPFTVVGQNQQCP